MGLGAAISNLFATLARLFLPVVFLMAAYACACISQAYPIVVLDPFVDPAPGTWLTARHIAIMIAFFISMLSNRARGPAFAFAQLVLTWLVLAAVLAALIYHPIAGLPAPTEATLLAGAPFLGALFAAHVVNILVFDGMRGIPWWRAPFFAGIFAAVTLPVIYWFLVRTADMPWLTHAAIDAGVKAFAVLVLLFPFAMLRSATRPRNGFGGY